MSDIKYEPTREHWKPYEPWMRDVLASDARVSWVIGANEYRSTWDRCIDFGGSVEAIDYIDRCLTERNTRIHPDDVTGEPVEPGDLRAGDRVEFTWMQPDERITCTLVSVREGAILRSDTPDKDDYYPNVVVQGKWCSAISDVRLIERAPREDEDPDEALAKVLRSASERLGDWGALHETTRDEYRNMARAAREHIEAEWKPYILREQTAREKAQDRAAKAEAERDALRERLDALRADVDRHARRAGKKVWTRATGRDAAVQDALWDILARDTARAKGER